MFRQQRIINELTLLEQSELYEIKYVVVDGVKNTEKWIVWVAGRKGTVWQGGVYPLTITIPKEYPKQPPIVSFDQDFQHIHVYEGGSICLPVVDHDYWKPGRTMGEVLSRLDSFLHQPPNVYSPANEQLLILYLEDVQAYNLKIREQAKRYSKMDEKHSSSPCVHVFFANQQ